MYDHEPTQDSSGHVSRLPRLQVFEETGLDIAHLINPNEYVESTIHDQLSRLYFVTGINKNISFEPQTKGEIRAVKWFPIEQLPVSKRDILSKCKSYEQRYFYMVIPFMKWVSCFSPRTAESTCSYNLSNDLQAYFELDRGRETTKLQFKVQENGKT